MSDYPAAHSMDTTWFAVDRCGHVAIFDSGEEGAVANGAPDAYEIFDDVFRPGELRWTLERSKDWKWGEHKTKPYEYEVKNSDGTKTKVQTVWGMVILAPGLELWARERVTSKHLATGRTDNHLWLRGTLELKDWQWLHEASGRCMGCLYGELLTLEQRCELYGIYRYDCPAYGHPPYERGGAPPPMPATLAMLKTLFTIPTVPVFPLCFGEKPRLQPKEHLESRLYGDNWVKEDGTPMSEEQT